MHRPLILPPNLASRPFTVEDALASGVRPGSLRNAQLAKPSRGIRIPGNDKPVQLPELARVYSTVWPYSAASHATAFSVWQMPGFHPQGESPGIHISRRAGHTMPRRRGAIGHETNLLDEEVCAIEGLWITTRVRTWLDVSRLMSVDELTVVADHLLRVPRPELEGRVEPYATVDGLESMLHRHKGTPGIRKARLALEAARVGSDSAPETRLRLAILRAGLPEPRLNPVLLLGAGIHRQPDMAFEEYRVAVEYEGASHSLPDQVVRDISREEDFTRGGWIQVRLSKRHMEAGGAVAVAKVRTALVSRGWGGISSRGM